MDPTTQLPSDSSQPTTIFVGKALDVTKSTNSVTPCAIFLFEDYIREPSGPVGYSEIGDIVSQWESDPDRREAMRQARGWVAKTFFEDNDNSLRALRLRKGWSQAKLATEIASSQSHVARIERGTENLTIETCRKLCSALNIDLNTLDSALRRQPAIEVRKGVE